MCSLPTCNHILIANDIISLCTLLYLSNKIIPYHTSPLSFSLSLSLHSFSLLLSPSLTLSLFLSLPLPLPLPLSLSLFLDVTPTLSFIFHITRTTHAKSPSIHIILLFSLFLILSIVIHFSPCFSSHRLISLLFLPYLCDIAFSISVSFSIIPCSISLPFLLIALPPAALTFTLKEI